MLDDVALRLLIKVRTKLLSRNVAKPRNELDHLLMTGPSMNGSRGVELDAVAGAQQHRFAPGIFRAQRAHGGNALIGPERLTLAQRERRAGLIPSQQEQPL